MQNQPDDLGSIKGRLKSVLENLYDRDHVLFERNKNRALCERCLVFRFGIYLQAAYPDYFVDADYNSSSSDGRAIHGKWIENEDGRTTKSRYVDIIVHRRGLFQPTDFICFEIKKWTNGNAKEIAKDKQNLKVLTTRYGYKYGFYLTLGRVFNTTYCDIFGRGGVIIENKVYPSTW